MNSFQRIRRSTVYRVLSFAVRRGLIIFLTIFVGVFITVLAANRSGQIEDGVARQVGQEATRLYRESEFWHRGAGSAERDAYIFGAFEVLSEQAGLHLPYIQRHLRWTWNAMTLDWGDVQFTQFRSNPPNSIEGTTVRAAITTRLPNTLLLVGLANFFVFVLGLPAALMLARKSGGRLDRAFAFLAPLSSVPSWVIGVVLVLIFAVQFQILPTGGKTGVVVEIEPLGRALAVAKHLILPVSAIVLSLLFQFVYTWRSYFLVYSEEDYVELARARGLDNRTLERQHILRPTLPFIITSFTLSLVSFWQTTIALEVVFNWPGIGKLYLDSLPNFFGESMFPGDLVISVALVTIFAYLLGITILALEIVYALVDPRVQIASSDLPLAQRRKSLWWRILSWRKAFRPPPRRRPTTAGLDQDLPLPGAIEETLQRTDWRPRLVRIAREMNRYPLAIAGLIVIGLLVAGSLYALIGLPYAEVGLDWYVASATGKTYVPRTAMPEWINLFRGEPLLSELILNSNASDPGVSKTFAISPNGTIAEQIVFTFDYDYAQIPEEVFVYFDSRFTEKRPFVFWTWIAPDGRAIELSEISPDSQQKVELTDYVFSGPRALREAERAYPALADLKASQQAMNLLFGALDGEPGEALPGQYQLVLDGLLFEGESWVEAELVLLGQVHGVAGTDAGRRDLLVPLVWGMPFALLFGLFGAFFTIFVSLFAAAGGVWLGGWVDAVVQRLSDVNMVLPILAISVIFFAYFGLSLWIVLTIIIVFSAFGSPMKTFRSAFLQIKQEPYIESARAYGASNMRIISRYMVPRITPVLIPQLVTLIPGFVFLEATLGMFNIRSNYPTWGKVIYDALNYGLSWGSRFWVLQPLALLLLTGFAFAMVGFALDRILNPRLDHA